jgi:two-component system sensor histidine kinase ChvG
MHEIRNPLASIKMATEVIVDDTDIKQKKFLDMIQTDITRIENIITDYSAMIKDEAQLSKTESVIFDFKKLIIKIIADYKTLNEGKINFRFITSDDLNSELHLKGQQSFIEQSVKNIIDNAISFSKLGDTIIINLSSTANYLSLSISDEGPGIKEPIVEKIFERFYSLRESDENFQSTHSGLGLNIAKQIIDVHDGYISANNIIENNVVKGARFIVNLPMSK